MFGSGLGSGSTIGPDGALYVTDGNAGKVWRIDTRSGAVTQFASGLPPQVLGIGGAMDIAFLGHTAYVLVTMVGGDIVDGPHIGDDDRRHLPPREGRQLHGDRRHRCLVGGHPPATDFFITTGVQYALEMVHGGFLVTDGHHNRVLCVSTATATSREQITFGNIVPTGLETSGNKVYMGQAGPVPHLPRERAGRRVPPGRAHRDGRSRGEPA